MIKKMNTSIISSTLQKLIFILLISLLQLACSSDELSKKETELVALKERITQDSLLLLKVYSNIQNINQTLDSVDYLHSEMKGLKEVSKQTALEKISKINEILIAKNDKITKLESDLSRLKTSLPIGSVSESKKQIELQLKYYKSLKKELENANNENINLTKIIREKDRKLLKKTNIVRQIEKEKSIQKITIDRLHTEIIVAENEFSEAILTTAKTYYELSNEIRKLADQTSSIMASKKKKELINLAYEYYKKAYELGYNKAKLKIELMESEKKYYKYLDK